MRAQGSGHVAFGLGALGKVGSVVRQDCQVMVFRVLHGTGAWEMSWWCGPEMTLQKDTYVGKQARKGL